MKKGKRTIALIAFACVLLSGIAGFAGSSGKKPFENLKASEIASAAVRLIPPDKTVRIVETEELAEYLNQVVIYRRDDSYKEYAGQAVIFTLTMTDGRRTEVMACNPFLVIDGAGYRTKYEPCEALNQYANQLEYAEDAMIILEEPPMLDVISGEACNSTLKGTYSWQRQNDDGTSTDTEADSPHPLDCKDLLIPFETTETTALLRFTQEPDEILNVCCWSDEHWQNPAAESEDVSLKGNTIELKTGGYIYQITARWDRGESGCGGIASYSFYVKVL